MGRPAGGAAQTSMSRSLGVFPLVVGSLP